MNPPLSCLGILCEWGSGRGSHAPHIFCNNLSSAQVGLRSHSVASGSPSQRAPPPPAVGDGRGAQRPDPLQGAQPPVPPCFWAWELEASSRLLNSCIQTNNLFSRIFYFVFLGLLVGEGPPGLSLRLLSAHCFHFPFLLFYFLVSFCNLMS
jgi:hypothetical protein